MALTDVACSWEGFYNGGEELSQLPTFELMVKNGLVYTSDGFVEANVVADDGRILAITKSDQFQADHVLDARGKHVLPGLIDAHCHLRDPGYTHKEDFESGTKAAAAGGITMVVDMPNTNPVPNTVERYKAHVAIAQAKSVIDFNRFASPTKMDEISKIAKLGTAGFKIFMRAGIKDTYPYISETHIGNEYAIYKTLREIAKTGLVCAFHSWNQRIWQEINQEYVTAGKNTMADLNAAYETGDHMLVTTAVSELMMFAKLTGARVHICHANYRPIMDLIRQAKADGLNVTAEINPWLSMPFYTEAGAKLCGRVTASAYNKNRLDDIWNALNDGTIDMITSDHSPHTKQEFANPNAFEVPLGAPYIEQFLGILLTQVNMGHFALERLVKLCSENAAKELGFYPRKGTLRVGSDADITVVDMSKEGKFTSDRLYSKPGITPYEGVQYKGAPIYAISRGRVVMDHGEVLGKSGEGRFVPPLGQSAGTAS